MHLILFRLYNYASDAHYGLVKFRRDLKIFLFDSVYWHQDTD